MFYTQEIETTTCQLDIFKSKENHQLFETLYLVRIVGVTFRVALLTYVHGSLWFITFSNSFSISTIFLNNFLL